MPVTSDHYSLLFRLVPPHGRERVDGPMGVAACQAKAQIASLPFRADKTRLTSVTTKSGVLYIGRDTRTGKKERQTLRRQAPIR